MMLKARQEVFGLLLVGSFLILAGCGRAELAASTPGATPLPTPSVTPQPNGKATYTAMFEATEVAVIVTARAERTIMALTPTIPASPIIIITSTPIDLPLGILYPVSPGLSASEYRIENGWRDKVNGTYLLVYAGAYSHASDQGLLVVLTLPINYSEVTDRAFYDTPTMAGSIHIVAADGLRLTLLATSGAQFVFDAGTRQWLTATPGPAPSPGLSPLPTVAP